MLVLVLVACAQEKKVDDHNSRLSLDWAGFYQGTIPQSDNKDVYTDLELKEDQTFIKRSKKLDKDERLMVASGIFTWTEDGNSIILESDYESHNSMLKVQENRLVWQDIQGTIINEADNDNYVLTKIPGILKEREWQVTKIADAPVNIIRQGNNNHIYIYFDSDEKRVYGFGGSNFFRASYHLVDNEIAFTPILSTKMAGPNSEIENKFFKVLRETRKYEIVGNELYFMNENGLHLLVAETKKGKK
jgi:heat shock protein HslJ